MKSQIKYVFISFLLIIIQSQAMKLLSLEGMTPDILAIWIVYIALRHGQMSGTIWGFGIGLLFDLLTGNFIGLSALTKTVCGFTAGYFYNENKTTLLLSSYRFTLVILIVSFVQNVVYFIIFTQGSDIGLLRAIFEFGLATALYTATVSLLPVMFFARKFAH
jgi:rod shape-determining protein MreD